MKSRYIVITNNPYVYERIRETKEVIYKEVGYVDILRVARDEIHQGAILLSHPLSGSVKPKETPYKSMLVKRAKGLDQESVQIIESAILTCDKFQDKSGMYSQEVCKDFQLIDWGLIEGAMLSADAC
ncbi:MAG: GrdX family protein [Eubacteriales bacterium]